MDAANEKRINNLLNQDLETMDLQEVRARLKDLKAILPRASWPADKFEKLKEEIDNSQNKINELRATFNNDSIAICPDQSLHD